MIVEENLNAESMEGDLNLNESMNEIEMLPYDLLNGFQEGDQLIHYTAQAWTIHGPTIFDGYMVSSGSFFPEEAKIDYMRRFPGSVLRRNNIAIVAWSDQTHNIDKYAEHCEQDIKMMKNLTELREQAARGEISLALTREKLKEIKDARINA